MDTEFFLLLLAMVLIGVIIAAPVAYMLGQQSIKLRKHGFQQPDILTVLFRRLKR